ncbi:glycosyl hydrolase BNR repeat-containing protein [Rhodanobacter sp. 115]|nr:glycosyl hydrolase BNR repeat-containing protein [Rhodanobacter sp. 115]
MQHSVFVVALMMGMAGTATASGDSGASGMHLAAGTGYPSVVRLSHQSDASANGRLLLVFEQRPLNGGVPLYQSLDDGAHWQFMQDVTDQPHHGDHHWQLRWQPNITEMPRASGPLKAGTVLLAANATGNNAKGRLISEDLQLYASTDQGHSWHYRGSIVRGGGNPSDKDNKGVWEPNIHILDDGRMVAYYSSEQHKAEGFNQLLAHKVSRDGGRTWGAEHVDVAIPGGVERPGMAVVDRLPDGRYVMSYEDIDGPQNGHVYLKFSRDGLDWGDASKRGTPVQTEAGAWPAASPIVKWLPVGGHDGVIVVLAERAGGGGDPGGRSMYWNNDLGRGPWWEAPAPVQKQTGNIHAGWTQALLLQKNGSLLHITSSSTAKAPAEAGDNVILYATAPARFDRYEAEDAARHWAVQIGDSTASNRSKARVAAWPQGRLDFTVHVATSGPKSLRVRWQDLGFTTKPLMRVDGHAIDAGDDHGDHDGWHVTTFHTTLHSGDHTITLGGEGHALDIDYLQIDRSGAIAESGPNA